MGDILQTSLKCLWKYLAKIILSLRIISRLISPTNRLKRPVVLQFPLQFPTDGREIVETESEIDEEEYTDSFHYGRYPSMTIGEILFDRYQVLGKLGYGNVSTVWLVRDMKSDNYAVAKIYSRGEPAAREFEVFDELLEGDPRHLGHELLRQRSACLSLVRPNGDTYDTIIHSPLRSTVSEVIRPGSGGSLGRLPSEVVRLVVYQILLALDYMHTECKLIHSDIKGDNIFLEMRDNSVIDQYVMAELETPTQRKIVDGRNIYRSRSFGVANRVGGIELGDFGETLEGDVPHKGFIGQGFVYRAPEVTLLAEWNYPVDIWSLGCWTWEILEGELLFSGDHSSNNSLCTSYAYIGEVIGLLGPPPLELLEGGLASHEFFDEKGNFLAGVYDYEIQPTHLEDLETRLEGEEKEMFLDLMRSMIQWRPEDRKSAGQLLKHPWFDGVYPHSGCRLEPQ